MATATTISAHWPRPPLGARRKARSVSIGSAAHKHPSAPSDQARPGLGGWRHESNGQEPRVYGRVG